MTYIRPLLVHRLCLLVGGDDYLSTIMVRRHSYRAKHAKPLDRFSTLLVLHTFLLSQPAIAIGLVAVAYTSQWGYSRGGKCANRSLSDSSGLLPWLQTS